MPRTRSRTMTHAHTSRRHHAQSRPYILAVVALSSPWLLTGCGAGAVAQSAPEPADGIPVRVMQLGTVDDARDAAVTVTGTLSGKQEVALGFKVGGIIERISVDEGDAVRAGQVLASLRPTEIAAQVAIADEGRRKAERDLARVTTLYHDSVATLEQLQDARTAADVAGNGARVARFNAEHAVIRAPGDGIVLSRLAEPGQVVDPGRAVLEVRRHAAGLVVRAGLPDRQAVRVRIGDRATVRFDALPGRTFDAAVTQRAVVASTGSGDYAVEVTLRDAGTTLPSGLVAQVRLQLASDAAQRTSRVTVPLDALVDADGDSAAVFVLRADGRAVSRRVVHFTDVTEALTSARVPVVRGLDGGETIVTAGMSRLVDGALVRPVAGIVRHASADADASPRWTMLR